MGHSTAADFDSDTALMVFILDTSDVSSANSTIIAAQVSERVSDVVAQQIEMLARRGRQDPADRVPPQAERGTRASAREDLPSLIGEGGGHVVAEVAAKIGGEEPQQRAEDAVSARHV